MTNRQGQVTDQVRQEGRIQELEFVVTHIQKTVEELNTAMLLQQKTIDVLCRQLEQAKSDVQTRSLKPMPPASAPSATA